MSRVTDFTNRPLGRVASKDFKHISLYPLSLPATPVVVESSLPLPAWHASWDQGQEGACVGFGSSMMMSIRNNLSAKREGDMVYWDSSADPATPGSVFSTAVFVHVLAMPYHLIPLYQR